MLAGFGLAIVTGVVSVLGAVPAAAHAQLEKAWPADGSTVTSAPSAVVLTFSEAVSSSFAAVQVEGPDGQSVSDGRPRVDGAVVTQALASPLGPGRYTVAFRVVSSDGHPVSDTTSFTLEGAKSGSSTSVPTSSSGKAIATAAPSGTAATSGPTNVFDSSHVPGFIVVGLLVLGAVGLLLWERRPGHR